MELFKTLIFTDKRVADNIGKYCHIIGHHNRGGSNTPILLQMTASLENIVKAYPKIDFSDVAIITVTLKSIFEE